MFAEKKEALAPYRGGFVHNEKKIGIHGIGTLHCMFLLTTLSLAAYWPVFRHGFQTKWDDWWVVMNDYTEGGFSLDNIRAIIGEFYHGQYAPVNEFFYLVLYNLFGYNASWFHAASLLVHIGNVLLVFLLIKRVLQRSASFSPDSVLRISLMTATLMAIHPFMVEAVSWMAASKCILFTFFYLLALHAYISYTDSHKPFFFLLTVLCFVLSFGAKEQAVTLPVCLLLFDYVLKRNMRDAWVWLEKAPLFIMSAGFALVTFYSQQYNGEGILSKQLLHPWYQDIAFAAYSVTEYFIKCLLPLRLSYIYPFPNLPGEPMPLYLWLYCPLLLIVTIAFWKFWRQRWNLFGTGFFLIQISIVCNLIPTSRFAIIADRYVYLPAVGIFFLMAYHIDLLLKNRPKYKLGLIYGGLLYLLCLGIYTNQRTRVWRDSDTLKEEMKAVLQSRPDYKDWEKKF